MTMTKRPSSPARACVLVLCAGFAVAWGPITHYSFACQELAPHMPLQECIATHPDLIAGDDFPDAFYFDRFIEGSNCTGFSRFHDNAFATQMLLSARTFKAEARPGERTFNATQFALGYASHMYADDVGFYSTAIAPSATYLNWLPAWTYMVAIDAATPHATDTAHTRCTHADSQRSSIYRTVQGGR